MSYFEMKIQEFSLATNTYGVPILCQALLNAGDFSVNKIHKNNFCHGVNILMDEYLGLDILKLIFYVVT